MLLPWERGGGEGVVVYAAPVVAGEEGSRAVIYAASVCKGEEGEKGGVSRGALPGWTVCGWQRPRTDAGVRRKLG